MAAAREQLEQARLAAQETRLRRESLAEQFAQTRFDIEEVMLALAETATVLEREDQLAIVQADLQRLGGVNLAAIDELKEQSERKTYLDAQCKDLTDALESLEAGDAQDRQGDAIAIRGHLRADQRRAAVEIPAAVWRRTCLPGAGRAMTC